MSDAKAASTTEFLGEPGGTLALIGVLAVLLWLLASKELGLAVIGVAGVGALWGARRRWMLAPLGAFAFLVPLPFAMWYMMTGEGAFGILTRIHPGTLYLLVLVACGWRPNEAVTRRDSPPFLRRDRFLVSSQCAFVVLAGGMTLALRGFRGLSLLLDDYVGPFVCYWLLVWLFRTRRDSRSLVGTLIGVVGAILATVAIVEFMNGRNAMYERYYGDVPWFPYATGEYRSTISFGAPLAAANALLLALVAVTAARSIQVRVAVAVLVLAGVLATGSRSAAALALLVSPLTVLAPGESPPDVRAGRSARVVALGTVLVLAVLFVGFSGPGQIVLRRVLGSWQSTAVRVLSAEYFTQSAGSYVIHGVGLGGSTDVSTAALGSYITFENPWIMLAVDVGIPLTLLFASVLGLVFFGAMKAHQRRWGILVGCVALLAMESAYNSFGVRSIAAYYLWGALAFLVPDNSS